MYNQPNKNESLYCIKAPSKDFPLQNYCLLKDNQVPHDVI